MKRGLCQERTWVASAIVAELACGSALAQSPWRPGPEGSWTHLAGNSQRVAVSRHPAPDLSLVAWKRSLDSDGRWIEFVWNASPVACGTRVYAAGKIQVGSTTVFKLFAFFRNSGNTAWEASLPPPVLALDPQSSPALDFLNQTVVMCSGQYITALAQSTGAVVWQTLLPGAPDGVVNASPLVTGDMGPRNRAFITSYDGFGQTAKLYCINVDPFHVTTNPYQPGEIVWSVPIGGATGSSPAYLPYRLGGDGLVYVANVGNYNVSGGQIFAYDATKTIPTPRWFYTLPAQQGFFGGVSVGPASGCKVEDEWGDNQPTLWAATYGFTGCVSNSHIVAVNASTGAGRAVCMSNRSNTIPVPYLPGRVVHSGGLYTGAYGSVPSVRKFTLEHCDELDTDWDSALDTWNNPIGCAPSEGNYLPMGGWQMQPAVAVFGKKARLLCGLQAEGILSDPAYSLNTIKLDTYPGEPDWIEQTCPAAGGAPALVGANMYSIGIDGLLAFGPAPVRFDTEFDQDIDLDDLAAWERGFGIRDIDADGDADADDKVALVTLVRCREGGQLTEGRWQQ